MMPFSVNSERESHSQHMIQLQCKSRFFLVTHNEKPLLLIHIYIYLSFLLVIHLLSPSLSSCSSGVVAIPTLTTLTAAACCASVRMRSGNARMSKRCETFSFLRRICWRHFHSVSFSLGGHFAKQTVGRQSWQPKLRTCQKHLKWQMAQCWRWRVYFFFFFLISCFSFTLMMCLHGVLTSLTLIRMVSPSFLVGVSTCM